jgi:ATP-dependent DNA ligase
VARLCSMERLSVWINAGDRSSTIYSFHRGEPCFFAFDLLMSDGKDLRSERLTDGKHELRRLLSKVSESRMRYVEHVEQYGTALFQRACKMDLEGIVAKHSFGNYVTEAQRTTWSKSRTGITRRWLMNAAISGIPSSPGYP